jgi:hypothetical protein
MIVISFPGYFLLVLVCESGYQLRALSIHAKPVSNRKQLAALQ